MHSFICCDYVSERVTSRGCGRTLCDLSLVWFASAVSLHLQVLAYKWFHSWANASVRNPSSPVSFCCLPVKSDTAPHCYVQPNQPLHIPSAYERFFASLVDTKEQPPLADKYTVTFECEPCLSSGSCSQMIPGSCELPWLIVKHVLVNQTYPSGSSSTGATMSCLSRSSQRGVIAAHLPRSIPLKAVHYEWTKLVVDCRPSQACVWAEWPVFLWRAFHFHTQTGQTGG